MTASPILIPTETIDQIARRVLELLPANELQRLVTVEELAEHLGTSTEWVRRHQAQLGGYRLGDGGGRSPIRFRVADVEKFLERRRLTPPRSRSSRSLSDPDWALPDTNERSST